MRPIARAAVVVVALLSACGEARVDESGTGGGAHPIPFVDQHAAVARSSSIASCAGCHDDGGSAPSCTTECH